MDGHGRSQQKLVRTLSGHGHRINSLALNCDYVLRTGAFELTVARGSDGKKGSGSAASGKTIDNKDSSASVSMDISGNSESTLAMNAEDMGGERHNSKEEERQRALQKYEAVTTASGGEVLVSGSDDFTLFMWRPTEDKAPVARLTGHQQLVNHILFSPDSRYLASASFDKKVKLWCGRTGRFITTFNGHAASVYQLAWSADSCYIVSASKDSTLKLWSVKDHQKALYTLPGHEDEVYALDWSPNGTQVASGSKDRTIRIWHH